MKILNFGSLNVDYVYTMDHILIPGETQSSLCRNVFAGGKGLNQSVALAKAGLPVWHAGLVGDDEDGSMLLRTMEKSGVHTELVGKYKGPCGHTVIQVDKNGQNCILLFGGGNRCITEQYRDEVLSHFGKGDVLILQNEVNDLNLIIDAAYERGITIALNPSPYDAAIERCNLSKVALLFVNEIEGAQIGGTADSASILDCLQKKYPNMTVVLTLGADGAKCLSKGEVVAQNVYPTNIVDTTAAGDTFEGFFLYGYLNGKSVAESLDFAARAAAVTISRAGAAESIPMLSELLKK